MLRIAVTVAALVLFALGSLRAQVVPGAYVRITPAIQPGALVQGSVLESSPDHLILAQNGARDSVVVSVASIDHVQLRVARYRPGLIFAGAGAGLFVGAVGGALVGPLFTSACLSATKDLNAQAPCAKDLVFDMDARLRGALAFGLGGAVLGAVVGGIAGRERWRRVQLNVGSGTGSELSAGATVRF